LKLQLAILRALPQASEVLYLPAYGKVEIT